MDAKLIGFVINSVNQKTTELDTIDGVDCNISSTIFDEHSIKVKFREI